jgi:hypothetical protein
MATLQACNEINSGCSWGLVSCSISHAFFSQSPKLTVITDQEYFFALQDAFYKMVAGVDFSREFASRIDSRIHLAPEFRLSVCQARDDIAEGRVTDH